MKESLHLGVRACLKQYKAQRRDWFLVLIYLAVTRSQTNLFQIIFQSVLFPQEILSLFSFSCFLWRDMPQCNLNEEVLSVFLVTVKDRKGRSCSRDADKTISLMRVAHIALCCLCMRSLDTGQSQIMKKGNRSPQQTASTLYSCLWPSTTILTWDS